jgi:hypothetical protein
MTKEIDAPDIPKFSVNHEEAWNVVKELCGWGSLGFDVSCDGDWVEVHQHLSGDYDESIVTRAETMPKAVCLHALRVFGRVNK